MIPKRKKGKKRGGKKRSIFTPSKRGRGGGYIESKPFWEKRKEWGKNN